ncbi:MAG: acyl carrier protein [Pseudonocardiaceae bacterium]
MYLETICQVLRDLGIDEEVTGDALLRDELGMDSQEIIDLFTELERRLQVTLPNRGEVIAELRSVADVMLLLEPPQRCDSAVAS